MNSITEIKYNSFLISHDGEGDDIQALIIARDALNDEEVVVDCVIGNPDIAHAPQNPQNEMSERISITNEVFAREVAIQGTRERQEASNSYIAKIISESENKKCLVLHTDSFKSLVELFKQSKLGQLKNVVFLSYGSINLDWGIKKLDEEPKLEDYKSFYDSLSTSGAKLVQVEAYPFLGLRNKLTSVNTPLSYSLLEHLDGSAGKKWVKVNASAGVNVRIKQAEKVADSIVTGSDKADDLQRQKIVEKVSELANFFDKQYDVSSILKKESLVEILNQNLGERTHNNLQTIIKELSQLLIPILKEKIQDFKEDDFKRPFNIYAATSLPGQALIADQIPAIIFSELVEQRTNGIVKECLPVKFEGLNGKFVKYSLTETPTSLFCLNTKMKIEASTSKLDEKELTDSYLKYIDLCIAVSLIENSRMISSETREKLLQSAFKDYLSKLMEDVKKLGYDLPKSCQNLKLS